MLKKVVLPSPRVLEYDNDYVKGYIEHNKKQILEYLQNQATADPWHLFKPNDLEVAAVLKHVFDSCDARITEIAHMMVGLRREEYRVAMCAKNRNDVVHHRFVISMVRLEASRSISEIANFCNDIRKEHELKGIKVPIAMELLITALESLPAQNFYIIFSGIKETKAPN